MSSARFGELLGRFVPLSGQDVSEILEDQAISHRRFGQIALSLGLCRPEHLWRAWGAQLAYSPERVDLKSIGIDTQALTFLAVSVARDYGVIPVRSLPDLLILAASEVTLARAAEHLPGLLNKKIQFVLADAEQIEVAIRDGYPAESPAKD
jgi:type IV pilus assembly protein PilB